MKIQIPTLVYDKIMHWINKTDNEVSGFGTVKYNKDTNSFDVLDAYLLKQEGGAAHTDIDANSLSKLMYLTRNSEGDLKWWWHSHVNMPVFWSGTDEATIKDLGKHGHIVATVFNKKREYKSAICYTSKADFNELIHHDPDIPTVIVPVHNPELTAIWDAEYEENVKEKKWSPSYHNQWGWQYNQGTAAEEKEKESVQDSMSMREDPGYLGYGLIEEARILGMAPIMYQKFLDTKDTNSEEWAQIELKLLSAEGQGFLR